MALKITVIILFQQQEDFAVFVTRFMEQLIECAQRLSFGVACEHSITLKLCLNEEKFNKNHEVPL
jgi:hypothetical protein